MLTDHFKSKEGHEINNSASEMNDGSPIDLRKPKASSSKKMSQIQEVN